MTEQADGYRVISKEKNVPEVARLRFFEWPKDEAAARKLDLGTLYAHNPRADTKAALHAPMTPSQLQDWLLSHDQEEATLAICSGSLDEPVGFVYTCRGEAEVSREPAVTNLAELAGVTGVTRTIEINFDVPRAKGSAYMSIATSAMRQALQSIFARSVSGWAVVMHVEDDDLETDGKILQTLGFKRVGQLVYDQNDKPEPDNVFVVTRSTFLFATSPESPGI